MTELEQETTITFHAETLRRQRELLRRREADAVHKQVVSTATLRWGGSWTAILRVMRRRMVRDLRGLGVETPVYWVAVYVPELKAIEVVALAGRNRVRLGRRYRHDRRLEALLADLP